MKFIELFTNDFKGISKMSHMATEIVREHFDPIIGKAQNDLMISLFQTEESISKQLKIVLCLDLPFLLIYYIDPHRRYQSL
ncbi:hypothetical protein SAMN05421493_12828 [Pseudobutyrivibrio sp. 49]|nr:hypothetical protein SAMN05421493_12828 [Pseudobutyrivibrio sp. 49]